MTKVAPRGGWVRPTVNLSGGHLGGCRCRSVVRRLADWCLDPDITYLNHGTVGAVPRRVLAVQQAWRDRMERQPSQVPSARCREPGGPPA